MTAAARILVVEDSVTQAVHLRAILERNGWEVTVVSSAEEALATLPALSPHLLIVDYYLPGIHGGELCRQLRMRFETRTLPIVVVTGRDLDESADDVFESGADDLIQKSADPDHIVHRVRSLLRPTEEGLGLLSTPASYARPSSVLAIEDSATYLEFLRQELAGEPYALKTCSSAKRSLDLVGQEAFDCVVIDLVMPQMDGVEVCRRIREKFPEGEMRPMILMLTGREDIDAARSALSAGADDFARKSSNVAQLRARIRALLRRKLFEEGNRRILAELTKRELLAQRAMLEKQAAEARASLADRLEQSNRELEEFVSVAAHDLKAPLRRIGSLAGLIEEQVPSSLDAEILRDVRLIVQTTSRMTRIIDDLLQYSRLKDVREPAVDVSLVEVLEELRIVLAEDIEQAGARVEYEGVPSIPAPRSALFGLIQNLVANGIKFRGEATPHVRVACREVEGGHEIQVTDNGIGIDPKHHERIFAPFERLHSESDYPGTGIGLATCKRIVERLDGRIWVESRPAAGTTFHMLIPRRDETEKDHAPAASPSAGPEENDTP